MTQRLVRGLALIACFATDAGAATATPPSFAAAIAAVMPAVVTIVRVTPPAADPFDEQMDDEIDGGPMRAAGSGVIIEARGIVLTNAHIVETGAVEVVTADGRRYRPSRIARDRRSNLAVLVIGDGATTFPAARLGDSDRVRVGDWVVALGAPFGLRGTATAGILSARTADDDAGLVDVDRLQTTAVMAGGSSGGPLVNLDGEVIGVNLVALIDAVGVAFTIPSRTARRVLPDLIEHGRVRRATLGVLTQPLTADLARALGAGTAGGLLVADVARDGIAAAAGVRSGDVLLELDRRRMRTQGDLARALQASSPGRPVELLVRRRDGREQRLGLTAGEADDTILPTSLPSETVERLGIDVRGVTPDFGVVVARLERTGVAAAAGLRPGDVIREVNHTPVADVATFARLVDRLRADDAVALLVQRDHVALYVGFRLDAPPVLSRTTPERR